MNSVCVTGRRDCLSKANRSHISRSVFRSAEPAQAQRGFEQGLSGDVLAMFHEAQRNILELNKSRLMALDELKQYKDRNQELEERCKEYERMLEQGGGSVSTPPPATASKRSGTVTIAYSTGWSQTYIHYRKADGKWTEIPGEKMDKDLNSPGLFIVQLPQDKTEFVFNNGENDWDSPAVGGNYAVPGPGEYLVQSGNVSQL